MSFKGKHGPLLIAEIGGNHEGDFKKALELTKLALETEVDAIKFQIYTGGSLVNREVDPNRFEHFKKFTLDYEKYIELADICNRGGKRFIASIWDIDAIDVFDAKIPIYKVGSGDLTAYPLLKKIAKTGKPIILSSGLATIDEVKDALEFVRSVNDIYINKEMISILQCTAMYPIPESDSNLCVMEQIENLGVTKGYSDHTTDFFALKTAYSMGAEILEFHFTNDPANKTFRDHLVSLTKDDVASLVSEIERIKVVKGSRIKEPTKIELDNNHIYSFRRAVYLRNAKKPGDFITEGDLIVLRPESGIKASDFYNLVGKRCLMDIDKYLPLNWDMFDD